ncbi:MAG: DnaJ domain-containing protein [Bacteroidales bacterium]|nr:DnaJ domain-containing protein [Bacteroidales bacterium]
MGCLFSFLGFLIGGFFLGWPGAIGGALLGSLIDNGGIRKVKKQQHYYQANMFLEHELVLAAYVARADNNRLLQSELNYMKQFLLKNLDETRAQAALLRFRDILDENIDIAAVCQDIRNHATMSEKLMILNFLFGFGYSDSNFNNQELQAIQQISDLCGVSRTSFEAVRSMYERQRYQYDYQYDYGGNSQENQYGGGGSTRVTYNIEDDYKILEVSPDATDEEVKKAYREAAKKHHPDKVGHLGEDVRKAAEEKFAQVNNAYERIKKARGMK